MFSVRYVKAEGTVNCMKITTVDVTKELIQ